MAMTKRKKKLILIISLAVVVVAIAVIIVLIMNKEKSDKLSWKEISAQTDVPDNDYSNIIFTENCVLNIPDTDGFSSFSIETGWIEEQEATDRCLSIGNLILGDVFTQEDFNKDGFEVYNRALLGKTIGEEYYSCSYSKSNTFLAYKQSTVTKVSNADVERIIRLDRGETTDGCTYKVAGQDYSAQQALDYAIKLVNETLKDYLDDVEYRATNVIVLKNKNADEYYYRVQFENVIDNVPVRDSTVTATSETSEFYMYSNCMYVSICEPDKAGEVYKMGGISLSEEKELEDSYIPLDDALRLASDFMAEYYEREISEISVKYIEKGFYGDEKSNRLEPYWCFISDTEYDPSAYTIRENEIMVNMSTGEVIVYVPEAMMYKSSLK